MTWDLYLLVALILGGLVYGFIVGRDRAVTVLLSTYIALAVVTNTPILGRLSSAFGSTNPTVQLIWFAIMFAAVFGVLWWSQLLRSMARERGTWWEIILFSILQVGLTVSAALFLLPPDSLDQLSPVFREIFTGEIGRSLWMIAPIIFLAVIGRTSFALDDDEDEG